VIEVDDDVQGERGYLHAAFPSARRRIGGEARKRHDQPTRQRN
jgi:hypothetical protein